MHRVCRFFVLVYAALLCSSRAQLCPLPDQSDILSALKATLAASADPFQFSNESFGSGDVPSAPVEQVEILTTNFTCLAARGAGEYSYVSVVVEYCSTTAGSTSVRLMPCDVEAGQIQLVCTYGLGSAVLWKETEEGFDDSLPTEPLAIPKRSDCWKCLEDGTGVDTISNCLRK